MGSQLLQNTEIIKQTDVFTEENMDFSRIRLAVTHTAKICDLYAHGKRGT